VCFNGDAAKVNSLKAGLQGATHSAITLGRVNGRDNCVTKFTPDAHSEAFADIQQAFTALVGSPDTYSVSYSYAYPEYDPSTRTMWLLDNWNGLSYRSLMGSTCTGGTTYSQPGQILAHELSHAFSIGIHGAP